MRWRGVVGLLGVFALGAAYETMRPHVSGAVRAALTLLGLLALWLVVTRVPRPPGGREPPDPPGTERPQPPESC